MTDIPVHIDFENLFKTHCSFLGRTGSGKTYFMKNLLKKINIDFLVISPTDEYDSLIAEKKKNIKSDSEISLKFNMNKIRKILNLNYSELDYLRKFLADNRDLGIIDSLALSERMVLFFTKHDSFSGRQGDLFLGNVPTKKNDIPKYAGSLCTKFANIDIFINFNKVDNSEELPMVINTQGFSPESETMIIYSFLIDLLEKRKRMFNSNKRDMRDILIVLEEAHNYAPSVRTVICKDAVIRLAREGRKYGLHLLILTHVTQS
jgi:DNA helicase HerA-like ATPase